ncbi:hypothetical protein pipiens_005308 [Culex pipiens pipiens]|uniref:Uncharacterized protein n=1 Tax=Culex pipiens pipiens TaxID=38569 RepID=A0ABD1DY00_CULPP
MTAFFTTADGPFPLFRFLRPFVCILGLVGLRPNAVDRDLATLLGHLQSITVLALLLAGYVLQYLSGFR